MTKKKVKKKIGPIKVLVRSIGRHRIHLGGGQTVLPGEACEVTSYLADRLVDRGMAEIITPESK